MFNFAEKLYNKEEKKQKEEAVEINCAFHMICKQYFTFTLKCFFFLMSFHFVLECKRVQMCGEPVAKQIYHDLGNYIQSPKMC